MWFVVVMAVAAAWMAPSAVEAQYSQSYPQQPNLACWWTYSGGEPDSWYDLEAAVNVHGRDYHGFAAGGPSMYMQVWVQARGEFLPSTQAWCQSRGTVYLPSSITYDYPWAGFWISWTNTSCDYHSELHYPSDPDHPYYVSEEMYNTNATQAFGAETAGSYWTSVGQELGFSTLNTSIGTRSVVYPNWSLPPTVAARWDQASNEIWLNPNIAGNYSQAQWEWLTAHELGHAIGLGHSGTHDHSRTIMMDGGEPGTGLSTRKVDKCAAVKVYPVDIQVQD
jgi:hypothetical protein